MKNEENKDYTPILPFDGTVGENYIIYDNTIYTRNNELCNEEDIKIESGNVCKFYSVKATQPQKIGGDKTLNED